MSTKQIDFSQAPNLPLLEEEVLDFWRAQDIFQKSVAKNPKNNSFTFYDGPPFATGLPHYGHILASTTKDVIPRYQTMKGKRVERVWGWDCHGLPLENLIEQELNLKDKQAIETYGIAKFNQACENRVLTYAKEWQQVIERIGRFVDMEHAYKTMDLNYMESVWWVFKSLFDRDLIYQGYKPMHICPRCSTPLSNFEVSQGYKDVEDITVTVEFVSADASKKFGTKKQVRLLAWTTTPWTLPGNELLAVNPESQYVLFKAQDPNHLYLAAKDRLKDIMGEDNYAVIQTVKGKDLIGLAYTPIFPYFAETKNAFRVVGANFVTMEDGTGIVHIAPAFGEDDFALGQRENLPLIQHVDMNGKFKSTVTDFAGEMVKPKVNPNVTDAKIVAYLEAHDTLFKTVKLTHSYPHCWRCDTPLLNYATESWFVEVEKIKKQLLENNDHINWLPEHIQHGRFGKWLEGARDWAISRNRFWGAPLPLWRSDDGELTCVGSASELEKLSGQKVTNLHKQIVDKIEIVKDGKTFKRISEVLDCWFESGAMPYASTHYPFEHKAEFDQNFPAEFISEGQDQTRGWFYTLHVLATALTTGEHPAIEVKESTSAFKNCVVSGIVLAADGKKMSKRLKNYPDPMEVVGKYGADSLRLYFMSSNVIKAENLNFNEKEVADLRRKVFVVWWNLLSFFKTFAADQKIQQPEFAPVNVMDQWLLSRLHALIQEVTANMDNYDLVKASRALIEFVNELSTWYLRLSRERLRDKNNPESGRVFGYSLAVLSQLFAPFAPFFSDLSYHILVDEQTSVHLSDWPKVEEKFLHPELMTKMAEVKKVVEKAHAFRKEASLKLRQPLAKLQVFSPVETPDQNLLEVLAAEVNVKAVDWHYDEQLKIELDTTLTPALIAEGQAREIVREIQGLRKKQHCQLDEKIRVQLKTWPKEFEDFIKTKAKISELVVGEPLTIL